MNIGSYDSTDPKFMKKVTNSIISIPISLMIIFNLLFPSIVHAYPSNDLRECIDSAKLNPIIQEEDQNRIESFCDCALEIIIDQEKSIADAELEINSCASYAFN